MFNMKNKIMVKEVKYQNKKKECEHDALLLLVFTLNVLLQKISILPHHPLATWKVYQFTGLNLSLKFLSVFFTFKTLLFK